MRCGLVEPGRFDDHSQSLRLSEAGKAARAPNLAHEKRIFGMLGPSARLEMASQLLGLWQAGTQ